MEACAEGWEANGDHCYLFGVEKKNWTAAEDFCRGEGGHLATVNTNATKEFVLDGLAKRNLDFTWIGGSDIEEEGFWKWTDCTPWEAEFWAPGEPNNGNKANCIHLILRFDPVPQLNQKWNDWSCNQEIEFLCSKKVCSSPDDDDSTSMNIILHETNNLENKLFQL